MLCRYSVDSACSVNSSKFPTFTASAARTALGLAKKNSLRALAWLTQEVVGRQQWSRRESTEGFEPGFPRGFVLGHQDDVLDVAGRMVRPHVVVSIKVGEGNSVGVWVRDAEIGRIG